MINGEAHGPQPATTVCQLHMRHFRSGDVLHLEPWRSKAFPVVKDLMVNRSAFDRIVQAGGFISSDFKERPPTSGRLLPPGGWPETSRQRLISNLRRASVS